MSTRVSDEALDILFRRARTFNAWLDKPVPDDLLRDEELRAEVLRDDEPPPDLRRDDPPDLDDPPLPPLLELRFDSAISRSSSAPRYGRDYGTLKQASTGA